MLLEQLAIAHHVIGQLHALGTIRPDFDQAQAYQSAAARLLGEFRRTALALKEYREAPPTQGGGAARPRRRAPAKKAVPDVPAANGHAGNGTPVAGDAVDATSAKTTDIDSGLASNRLNGYFNDQEGERKHEPARA
jgi:hypothetical protein